MKTMRKFLVAALAALAFTACNNDDVVPDDKGGIIDGIEGDAWVALKLKTVTATRALNDPDKELGTPNESKVTDAIVFFFDETQKYVTKVDLTADGVEGTPGQPTGISGAAFKIPKTSAYLLVVVNPSNAFKTQVSSITSAHGYDFVNNAISLSFDTNELAVNSVTKKDGSGSQNYFMMTNAKGDLEPSDYNGNLMPLILHSTQLEAEARPEVIYIDRVVAKVRVSYGQMASYINVSPALSPDPSSSYVVGNVEWVLNVTNKKYYPASKRMLTARENGSQYFDTYSYPGFVWSDRYEHGSYRVDPNFNKTNPNSVWIDDTKPSDQTAYNENYNYYLNDASISWNTAFGVNDNEAILVAEYCLENTQEEVDNYHAYTTHVLLKAEFAPSEFRTKTDENFEDGENYVPEAANIDWLKIGNGDYTFETLINWIGCELKTKYNSLDGYDTPIFESFNKYLIGILASPLTIPTYDDFWNAAGGYEGDFGALFDDLKDQYATAKYDIETAGSNKIANVTYYKGGINYYKIMIKHDNVDEFDFNNKLGEFGVVRNSVYDINIRSINKPGYPVIPAPDPKTPDEDVDPAELWISVQINVNPWTWYSQYENL